MWKISARETRKHERKNTKQINLRRPSCDDERSGLVERVGRTGEDLLEGKLDVGGVEGRSLDEGETMLFGQGSGLLGGHGAQMPQIALVADEHDDNVAVGVIAQLIKPPLDVLVRHGLGDVVDEQSTDGSSVVRARDGSVALLTRYDCAITREIGKDERKLQ